ncbi:MAG: S-adenosylmethionine decarboxylase [Chloroflexi bacterium HGW-Chloroflexi-6]|nr:MAG: S-adenosylmethionine decarboxylase [Chloroflexi bacterium HGW-Chloroflexi-6]
MGNLTQAPALNGIEAPTCWGVSTSIDLYNCDLALMQDAEAIREFVKILCDRIQMRRYGETQVVFFGDDPRVQGFSMTQLIETSLISAHFADASKAIYLDVFSCAPYDSEDAARFAMEYFKADNYNLHVTERR